MAGRAVRSYPVNRKPYRERGNGPVVEFICELPNGVHARPASHVKRCVILFHHKLSGITCALTAGQRQKRPCADWHRYAGGR